ncbi:MAG: type IV pilus biogenesis/stability protein PilW [Gammaproteobacteria bacterium]
MQRGYFQFVLIALFIIGGLSSCGSNKKLIGQQTDSPAEINAKLGLQYLRQGKFDVAKDKLEKALEYDSELVIAHHYIAELYRQQGNNKRAEEHYGIALDLEPGDAALQNNFGVFLCEQGQYLDAEKRFLKAINNTDYTKKHEAYENAGLCTLRIPDVEKAESYFRQALKINGKLPNSLFQLAQINFDKGDYLRARAFIQRYSAVARQSARSLWLGIKIEQKLGGSEILESYSSQLLDQFRDSKEAQMLRESQK